VSVQVWPQGARVRVDICRVFGTATEEERRHGLTYAEVEGRFRRRFVGHGKEYEEMPSLDNRLRELAGPLGVLRRVEKPTWNGHPRIHFIPVEG